MASVKEEESGSDLKLAVEEVIASLSSSGLDLFFYQVDQFLVVQRRRFDALVLGEPFHSIQLILDCDSGCFRVRVWGKTEEVGFVSSPEESQQLCWRTFNRAVACTGFLANGPENDFVRLESPFTRSKARNCDVTFTNPDDDQSEAENEDGQRLCPACVRSSSEDPFEILKLEAKVEEFPVKVGDDFSVTDEEESIVERTDDDEDKVPKSSKSAFGAGGRRVFNCPHEGCVKVFCTQRSLEVHLKNFHSYGPFQCSVCVSFECDYAHELFDHFVLADHNSTFKCPICDKSFHSRREDFLLHYPECWRIKRRQTAARLKQEQVAQVEKPSKQKKHQCDRCAKSFLKERLLEEHRNWHLGLKPLRCEECDFATCYLSSLYSHRQKHLREKGVEVTESSVRLIFRCDQCDKTFGRQNNLRRHQLMVHQGVKETRQCIHCGLVFTNKSQWRRHMLKKHSRDGPRCPCPVCGAPCIDRYELSVHMRVHKDPEFICRFCGKAVKSKQSLLAHERSHTGENPFKCELCDYSCKASSVLCKHKLLKHKKKPNTNWEKDMAAPEIPE